MYSLSPFSASFLLQICRRIITAAPLNEISTIKSTFNSYNHEIQFTIKESEGKICFLDILIIRDRNIIKTNWYYKPTWSGRFLNFLSHHPCKYKINAINNFVDRSITLAHKDFYNENIQIIKSTHILKTINYTPYLIDSIMRKRLNLLLSKNKDFLKNYQPFSNPSTSRLFHAIPMIYPEFPKQ